MREKGRQPVSTPFLITHYLFNDPSRGSDEPHASRWDARSARGSAADRISNYGTVSPAATIR